MTHNDLTHHILESIQRDVVILSTHNVFTPGNYDLLMTILRDPHTDVSQSFTQRGYTYQQETTVPPPVPPRNVPSKPPRVSDNPFKRTASYEIEVTPVRVSENAMIRSVCKEVDVKPRVSQSQPEKQREAEPPKAKDENTFAKRMGSNVANAASSGLGWGIGTGIARAII